MPPPTISRSSFTSCGSTRPPLWRSSQQREWTPSLRNPHWLTASQVPVESWRAAPGSKAFAKENRWQWYCVHIVLLSPSTIEPHSSCHVCTIWRVWLGLNCETIATWRRGIVGSRKSLSIGALVDPFNTTWKRCARDRKDVLNLDVLWKSATRNQIDVVRHSSRRLPKAPLLKSSSEISSCWSLLVFSGVAVQLVDVNSNPLHWTEVASSMHPVVHNDLLESCPSDPLSSSLSLTLRIIFSNSCRAFPLLICQIGLSAHSPDRHSPWMDISCTHKYLNSTCRVFPKPSLSAIAFVRLEDRPRPSVTDPTITLTFQILQLSP